MSGDIFINIEDAHCIETSTNYTNLKNEDLTYILTDLWTIHLLSGWGQGTFAGGGGEGRGERNK